MVTDMSACAHSSTLEPTARHTLMLAQTIHARTEDHVPCLEPMVTLVFAQQLTVVPTVKSLTHAILIHVRMAVHQRQMVTNVLVFVHNSTQDRLVLLITTHVVTTHARMEELALLPESHTCAVAQLVTQVPTVSLTTHALSIHARMVELLRL